MMQSNPKKLFLSSLSVAILNALSIAPASAYSFDQPVEKALKLGQDDGRYGAIKFNLNYRYEYVEVDNSPREDANANTLRLRFGYLTPEWQGLQGFAEYEGNLAMQEDYNSTLNGRGGFETVVDPEEQELNQLWLSYKGIPDTEIKGGRQRIKIDDDRFIGNVGWRQMEQTFDSVLITNQSIKGLTLKVGYIGRVQNIKSQENDVKLPFFNVNYNLQGIGSMTAYGLWIDDQEVKTKSIQTLGLAMIGSPKINDDLTLHYRAEYSYQSGYADNPNRFDLSRYHIMAGASVMGVTVKGAIEELGANGAQSFQTPLGTNHAFQGWADKFLTTPVNGVRDVYASIDGKVAGTKLMFVYHDFESVTSSIDYGNEYNFLVTKKFGKHYQLLAKYAYYEADQLSVDTHKLWLQASVSF